MPRSSWRLLLVVASSWFGCASCADSSSSTTTPATRRLASNPTECFGSDQATLDPNTDYFPDKVQPTESKYWTIEYHNTYKVVQNLESMSTFVLYPCGTEPPVSTDLEDAFNVTAYLPVPLQSVGVMMTPTITFLEQINELDTVEYFLTDPAYISSPCFLARVEMGFVVVPVPPDAVVDPTTGASEAAGPPNVTLNGTVAFGSSYDPATFFQTIVPFSEFIETTNQGTFEWVKYLSAFYNREGLANEVFIATQERWDCVSQRAASTATDAARPHVLWAYYSDYCGGWDVGSCPNYYCEYASACGADLVDPTTVNGTSFSELCGVTYLTTEELVQLGQDADLWMFPAPNWNATYETFKELLSGLKSVQAQQVYDYQGSGENAWFQERFAQYYDVLEDYCRVVGSFQNATTTTSSSSSVRGGRWFRNVFKDPVGDPGTCQPNVAPTLPFTVGGCVDDNSAGGGENNGTSPGEDGGTSSAEPPTAPTTQQRLLWATAGVVLARLIS